MIGWLLDKVPWWIWVAGGAAALVAAWRLLGWRGFLAALAAILTIGAYRHGRKTGASEALERQRKANEQAVKDHEEIEQETDDMSDAELDASNKPWLRH